MKYINTFLQEKTNRKLFWIKLQSKLKLENLYKTRNLVKGSKT